MKILFLLGIFLFANSSFSQNLWERNQALACVETKAIVDDVNERLRTQYGKDCDYLRDATRIVIGSFFKCPDGKTYPCFRSQVCPATKFECCKMGSNIWHLYANRLS